MRLPDNKFLCALAAVLALSGCATSHSASPVAGPPSLGPSGDYPVVLGDPFTIDGKVFTPVDKLNYDEVGYAQADADGGAGISASHRTLPLPSYVEITSLETGHTILVRAERRGPMSGDGLISLSEGAMAQLGASGRTPVRVRRVNPPEQERALLRSGASAPQRMATPMTLVAVLKRKLPGTTTPVAELPAPKIEPVATPIEPAVVHKLEAAPAPAPAPAPAGPHFVVQAGAFSQKANAERVAKQLAGSIIPAGKLYAVRTGPFANRGLAEASLAKVRGAGYSGARIYNLK